MLKRLVVSQCINKKLLLWNQTWLKVNRIHLLMKIPTAHRQHWTEKLPHDCVHTSARVCVCLGSLSTPGNNLTLVTLPISFGKSLDTLQHHYTPLHTHARAQPHT